ncbi:MAG: hypothetical protein NPIRA02_05200 [Nitrospirales bacterium]|nr:MAG: hypothetical protein NPIRA02_05200 [Nitrospirales bacterium]
MYKTITPQTTQHEQLLTIIETVCIILEQCGIKNGVMHALVQGATVAIMVQENWDDSLPLMSSIFSAHWFTPGVWLHDTQDGNGDSHLKAGLVGPSKTIPIIDGQLGLSRWQNIFFCEFDGPRAERHVVRTLIRDADDGR